MLVDENEKIWPVTLEAVQVYVREEKKKKKILCHRKSFCSYSIWPVTLEDVQVYVREEKKHFCVIENLFAHILGFVS
jgi:hypothetical protein